MTSIQQNCVQEFFGSCPCPAFPFKLNQDPSWRCILASTWNKILLFKLNFRIAQEMQRKQLLPSKCLHFWQLGRTNWLGSLLRGKLKHWDQYFLLFRGTVGFIPTLVSNWLTEIRFFGSFVGRSALTEEDRHVWSRHFVLGRGTRLAWPGANVGAT